jgi:hypothetical protein
MNYKKLLIKYMATIIEAQGLDHIHHTCNNTETCYLNDKDKTELEELKIEAIKLNEQMEAGTYE